MPKSITVLALGCAENDSAVSQTSVLVPPIGNIANVPNVMPVVVVVILPELVSRPEVLDVAVRVVKAWVNLPVFCAVSMNCSVSSMLSSATRRR